MRWGPSNEGTTAVGGHAGWAMDANAERIRSIGQKFWVFSRRPPVYTQVCKAEEEYYCARSKPGKLKTRETMSFYHHLS
jgi:hypothetical protein